MAEHIILNPKILQYLFDTVHLSTFPHVALLLQLLVCFSTGAACFNETLKEIEPCNPGPHEIRRRVRRGCVKWDLMKGLTLHLMGQSFKVWVIGVLGIWYVYIHTLNFSHWLSNSFYLFIFYLLSCLFHFIWYVVCALALSHEQANKTLSLFEGPSNNLHFYPWDGYIQHNVRLVRLLDWTLTFDISYAICAFTLLWPFWGFSHFTDISGRYLHQPSQSSLSLSLFFWYRYTVYVGRQVVTLSLRP